MATLARAVRGLARPAHSRLCTRALPQRQALSTLSPRTHSTAAAAAIDEEAEWAAAFKDAFAESLSVELYESDVGEKALHEVRVAAALAEAKSRSSSSGSSQQ